MSSWATCLRRLFGAAWRTAFSLVPVPRESQPTFRSASKHLTTTYSYDKLGRLTASTRTDGVKATYGYDAAGNRVSGTDTDRLTGQILGYQAAYSATNQLLTQTVQTATRLGVISGTKISTLTTSNTYDFTGQLTKSSRSDKLTTTPADTLVFHHWHARRIGAGSSDERVIASACN